MCKDANSLLGLLLNPVALLSFEWCIDVIFLGCVFVIGAYFIPVSPNKLNTARCRFVYCSLSQQFRSTSGGGKGSTRAAINSEQNAARTTFFFFFLSASFVGNVAFPCCRSASHL